MKWQRRLRWSRQIGNRKTGESEDQKVNNDSHRRKWSECQMLLRSQEQSRIVPAGFGDVKVTGDISESCLGKVLRVGVEASLSGLKDDSDPVFMGCLTFDSVL